MKKEPNTLLTLFTSTLYLSAFTFGGGYVIVPLMRKKFVDDLKWIDEEEMLNIVAIAQSSPGPIAVNSSILIGYRVAGAKGAACTLLGTILPPLVIISVISFFYASFRDNAVIDAVLKGMQSGVAAVITSVVFSMGKSIVKEKSILSLLIMVFAFAANYVLHINVALIILVCGVIGAVRSLSNNRKEVS